MKKTIVVTAFMLLATSVCPAQTTPQERMEMARRARSLAAGVNLISWDSSKPEGGWQRWWARTEQMPGFAVDRTKGARGVPALVLGGAGRRHVFGGWRYTIPAIEPNRYYVFRVTGEIKGVGDIRRSILCRVRWTGRDLPESLAAEYINQFERIEGQRVAFEQKFRAPVNAEGAVIELFVQWAPQAEATFSEVAFEVGAPIVPRVVNIATVHWDGQGGGTPDENIAALAALVDKAGAAGADVVLLPEAVTVIGTGLDAHEAAETLPGDTFAAFGEQARNHRCYVIYGVNERDGEAVYSSAIIINRDGTLAGRYRKVQVTPQEVAAGVVAGDFFRTFDLDFGRVGLLVGHDTAFAESARVQILDGAEMLFVVMQREPRQQLEARAMDNGVWIAASGVHTPSVIISPDGDVQGIAFGQIGDGVALRKVNLAERYRRPYVGDWQNQVIQQRRTDAYLKLVQE